MPSPLTQAGAVPEPSEYAPLTMDRYMTGIWTQRSPLRDADVPYLYTKFYSASRFDSIIDGLNVELTAKLTLARRCGASTFAATTLPGINTFYGFDAVNGTTQQIFTMSDGKPVGGTAGRVYYTFGPGELDTSILFTKSTGAGITRFLGVGPTLFMGNGVDQNKWLKYGDWPGAAQTVTPGTLVTDINSNVQMALGGITMTVVATACKSNTITVYFDTSTVPIQFPNLDSVSLTFSGLTNATWLNGETIAVEQIKSTTLGILEIPFTHADYDETAESAGSATTGTGVTGSAAPAWSDGYLSLTVDNTVQWKCYGPSVANWGIAKPTQKPSIINEGPRFWQPLLSAGLYYSILDTNGFVQSVVGNPGPGTSTGIQMPKWNPVLAGTTIDGGLEWRNSGQILSWAPSTDYLFYSCVLDSNGNLQVAEDVVAPGTSGSTAPTWNATVGDTTTDGDITWRNVGAGTVLASGNVSYGWSFHGIDGSVTTSSPSFTIAGGILGPATGAAIGFNITGSSDEQVDQIWVWKTAQGQSTLLLLDQLPNTSGTFTFSDTFDIPDTSTNGGPSLNALIAAPIASQNDPPPVGFTAPAYHMSRIWGIVGSTVYYSGGPDTVVGNGNTAFAPLSFFTFPELLTKLIPITVSNGGLLVVGTRNIYIILGTGTSSNPFFATTYMPTVGFLNYDAITMVGSTLYGFTNNRKFVSIDPSAGYIECGFPIGDQFKKVTTGGIDTSLYDPATTYVSWNERESGDSGIYVADGSVGWFRYSPVSSPESGYMWSPRAAIEGGTSAVMSVETSPGVQTLLIGPPDSEGPILGRDPSVFSDNGTAYTNTYATFGNIILCESGEVAEVAHIALDSMRVGTRPTVGLLFGEINATDDVPFDMLDYTCPDPPDLPESTTLYSDRYVAMQNGVCPKCRHMQMKIQWSSEAEANELLAHAIFGAKHAERKQQ